MDLCHRLVVSSFVALTGTTGLLNAGERFSTWSSPVNIGAPVNTPAGELTPEISRDERTLYFARLLADGTADLFVSKWDSDVRAWGEPEPLAALNSPAHDLAPTLSPDGRSLFFASNRPGGCGGFDVWVSRRRNKHEDFGNGGWRTASHLGCVLNTPSLEAPNDYREDEHSGAATLWVTQAPNPSAPTISDLCVSERLGRDEPFGACVPIPELNTEFREARSTLRRDEREIYLESSRPETANDLWVSTRESTCDPWSAPVSLGPTVNTVCPSLATCNDQAPRLSYRATALFFSSNRPGGGGSDIYVMTRKKLRRHRD